MEKLKLAFTIFSKVFSTLKEILKEPENAIIRDASIQRFKYTFETTWKLLKVYLYTINGIDCGSPKGCFRQALAVGMLSEEEVECTLRMCDDRNLTSHTYIEAIAIQIYHRLPQYSLLLEKLQTKIEARL
jgi:nucleotidyltransferase substrate binding protein (TIGR01987 family)